MCVSHNPRNKSIQSVEDDYWKHTLYPILELILDSQEFQEQTENMDRLIKEIDNVRDDSQRDKYKVEVYELLAGQLRVGIRSRNKDIHYN